MQPTPTIVQFVKGKKDGEVIAKINGKISFPESKGMQPKAGEVWEVTVRESTKVNFLTLVKKFDCAISARGTGASSNAARLAEKYAGRGPDYIVPQYWNKWDGGFWQNLLVWDVPGLAAKVNDILQAAEDEQRAKHQAAYDAVQAQLEQLAQKFIATLDTTVDNVKYPKAVFKAVAKYHTDVKSVWVEYGPHVPNSGFDFVTSKTEIIKL